MDEAVALVVGPGGGDAVKHPLGGFVTFKTTGADSAGRMLIFETVVAAGDGPPLHTHAREDEMLYVLEGEFRFQVEAEVHEAPVGSTLYVPPGVPHCFQNAGSLPGRLLIVFAPAGMEHFFAMADGDREAFATAGEVVGMEVVGPPLRD
jgi:quercetin dioxygenase-like cupin family protein